MANIASSGTIEATEQYGHVRLESCGYVADTGGAGRWRGCLSVTTELRILFDEGVLRTRMARRQVLPYGLAGGAAGTPSMAILNPGREGEAATPPTTPVAVRKGDTIRVVLAGGGGYGDPLDRDPDAVLQDILDEKVTKEYAELAYGVVIDSEHQHVDELATSALRSASKGRVLSGAA